MGNTTNFSNVIQRVCIIVDSDILSFVVAGGSEKNCLKMFKQSVNICLSQTESRQTYR